jgi:hypothetical protein
VLVARVHQSGARRSNRHDRVHDQPGIYTNLYWLCSSHRKNLEYSAREHEHSPKPPAEIDTNPLLGQLARLDAIKDAAKLSDSNRTDAVTLACDDMARLAGVLEEFLPRDDLTRGQQRDLADALDRALSPEVDVQNEVDIR